MNLSTSLNTYILLFQIYDCSYITESKPELPVVVWACTHSPAFRLHLSNKFINDKSSNIHLYATFKKN